MNPLKVIIGFVLIGVLLALFIVAIPETKNGIGAIASPSYYTGTTSATSSAAVNLTTLLTSRNTARRSLSVCNLGGNTLTVCKASTCTFNAGYLLYGTSTNPLSCFALNDFDPYVGSVSAVANATTSSSTVSITETIE